MAQRTIYCGLVSEQQLEQTVTSEGWIQGRRDLGEIIFIDLRDRKGTIQIVFNLGINKKAWGITDKCRSEYVIEVTGIVRRRGENAVNPKMATGKFRVTTSEIVILNQVKTPPLQIEGDQAVGDRIRLKYRYLGLRRPEVTKNIKLRNVTTKAIRRYLDDNNFLDIETPYLGKSTPKGARDYLVPSCIRAGHFYALPRSPQLFKQLLTDAGFDRYCQIVRYFHNEDLRGDRWLEFTQIDIETTFLTAEGTQTYTEGLIAKVMREVRGIEITLSFPRMTYDEAMTRYGNGKSDTRFEVGLIDLSGTVKEVEFKVFRMVLKNGKVMEALNTKGTTDRYSRKDMDQLGQYVGQFGAKGLTWLKVEEGDLKGPITKFMGGVAGAVIRATDAELGGLLISGADKSGVTAATLRAIQTRLGEGSGLIDESKFNFLWVTDWSQLEFSEEGGRYVSAHHPFIMPKAEGIPLLAEDPTRVHAEAYDVVLSGHELDGGSIRIYTREFQEKVLKTLGFTKEQMEEQFGFLLAALGYGFPSHGDIALGLDRFAMLLTGEDNIREVTAFPKNGKAADVMSDAPSMISPLQLFELNIDITNIEE